MSVENLRIRLLLPAFLGVGLVACEPMEPMGHPFQSVPATATATTAAAAADGDGAPGDERFAAFDEEPFVLTSDELAGDADGADAGADPDAPSVEDGGDDAEPRGDTAAAAAPAATPGAVPAPTAPAPTLVAPVPAAPLGWAIRLVTTVPDAQPPRAILGLPGGQEIVVTPGSMVPEAGLVVLSIGRDNVQLARVQASGDHADVEAFSIAPQYR